MSKADVVAGRRHLIVGIGASAGGLQALRAFLAQLGASDAMTVLLVQHVAPGEEGLLLDVLRPLTPLPVARLENGAPALPGRLVVAPAGHVVGLHQGRFTLRRARSQTERRTGIDRAFRALAQDAGPCAVGIVLSGSGSDGTLGLEAIAGAGGLTMAQDADSAAQPEMPRSAAAGLCDHVLPPADLARVLLGYAGHIHGLPDGADEIARHRGIIGALPQVCEVLKRVTGNDFRHYKSTTMVRRLERRMQVLQVADIGDYLERLEADEAEARVLFRELLIGVTAFFRDAEAFETLSAKALRPLLAGRGRADELRVWVPGCATGEEAYTIAMLAREAMDGMADPPRVQIFATDIDERALAAARRGSYPQGIAAQVGAARLERFFVRKGRRYQVTPDLREMCLFTQHNLISDPPFSRLDLISCRNLLIYMGPHLQKKLFPVFHYALKPGGYLLLGSSETLAGQGELFRIADGRARLAQRKDSRAIPATLRDFGGQGIPGLKLPDQSGEPDLGAIAQRILLSEFAPQYAIVGDGGQVMHLSERVDRFLQPPAGPYANAITRMARRGLSAGLRQALGEAAARRRTVVHEAPAVTTTQGLKRVRITVQPMPEMGHGEGLTMVVFEDLGPALRLGEPAAGGRPDAEAVIEALERELLRAREELERSIQDQEAANEELKSSNEELLSMNEELQSANEELEASKEEVQAAARSLEQANADLENLLRSTQIATIFLDGAGLIRAFTPAAADIYHVRASDTGRPLDEIRSRLVDLPDLPGVAEAVAAAGAIEHVARHADGRWFLRRTLPYRGSDGAVDGLLVTFVDISGQRRAEEERARAAALLAAVGESTPDAIYVKDRQSRMLYANPTCLGIIGLPAEQVLGFSEREFTSSAAEAEAIIAADEAVMASGQPRVIEEQYTSPDGTLRLFRSAKSPLRDADGQVIGVVGLSADITQAKRAEDALRSAVAFNRRILEASPDAIVVLTLDGRIESVSAGAAWLGGAALLGAAWPALWHDESRRHAETALDTARRSGTGRFRGQRDAPDGTGWWDVLVTAIAGTDGAPERLLAIARDVSEAEAADARLREAATVLDNMGEAFMVLDRDLVVRRVNAEAVRIDGRPAEQLVGQPLLTLWPEAGAAPTVPLYRGVLASGEAGEVVYHHVSPVHDVWLEVRAYPVPQGLAVFYRDVSDRERAREDAGRSAALLAAFVDAVPGLVYAKDADGRMLVANRGTAEFLGRPMDAIIGRTDAEFLSNPDQAAAVMANDARIRTTGATEVIEEPADTPDGRTVTWLSHKRPLRDADGRIVGIVGASLDISDRKRIEAELADALAAKDALLHEVNHRVKNSLQLVTSLLMLQAGQAKDPVLRAGLLEARGRLSVVAAIHQRLYATSAHTAVDFGEFVSELATQTLHSLGGEAITLDCRADPALSLPLAQAAPLALVVSELLTNAVKYAFAGRDRGHLEVVVAAEGDELRIEIADDGIGLPEGFDPTKGGLGMKIINALVRQVRGRLSIAGPPGTRFVIRMPMDAGAR